MLPEIFGLIQCIIGCIIVFKHSQKVVWHRKWVLHPVVAPIRYKKTRQKCPQNYHFGDVKIDFFLGRGHSPLPRTPPRRRIAPPFWNPKYATATDRKLVSDFLLFSSFPWRMLVENRECFILHCTVVCIQCSHSEFRYDLPYKVYTQDKKTRCQRQKR